MSEQISAPIFMILRIKAYPLQAVEKRVEVPSGKVFRSNCLQQCNICRDKQSWEGTQLPSIRECCVAESQVVYGDTFANLAIMTSCLAYLYFHQYLYNLILF